MRTLPKCHFYLGDTVEMTLLFPDGSGKAEWLGTTMAPGYDPGDFISPNGEALRKAYPAWREQIDKYFL